MRGMTTIVKTITRIVIGFIFVYGCYIVLFGHLSPGGGFAGGAIIATSFILSRLAFGTTEKQEKNTTVVSSIFESIGGIGFLSVALLGMLFGFYYFQNIISKGIPLRLASAGHILPANIAIGIKVGAALLSIFLGLASTKYIMRD